MKLNFLNYLVIQLIQEIVSVFIFLTHLNASKNIKTKQFLQFLVEFICLWNDFANEATLVSSYFQ